MKNRSISNIPPPGVYPARSGKGGGEEGVKKKINTPKPKIIVILGPTAGGKTGLGVFLASCFDGEIISADSRQVYRGMDIGTGKDLDEYQIQNPSNKKQDTNKFKIQNLKKSPPAEGCPGRNRGGLLRVYRRVGNSAISNQQSAIAYHLIDVVNPNDEFNLSRFQKLANRAIEDILKRKKIPIIVGGTGLYLQSIIDNFDLAPVKADQGLREKLEKMNTEEIFEYLKKLNSKFAKSLNPSDQKNKRRLIRYCELMSGRESVIDATKKSPYEFLIIGLNWDRKILRDRIKKRLIERIEKEGMIEEVMRLHAEGVSWDRLISFGLEYKFVSKYLKGEYSKEQMIEKLYTAICQFAKRQETWFRRMEKQGHQIHWLDTTKEKVAWMKESKRLADKFLK